MKKNILLLLIFFGIQIIHAQTDFKPGLIILQNGDTIHGFINYRSNLANATHCDFRSDLSKESKIYFAHDIKGYKIENSKYYVSKKVAIDTIEKQMFLEYLVDGIVDLYYLKGGNNGYYWLEKDGKMYRLSNEERTMEYEQGKLRNGSSQQYYYLSNQYKGIMSIVFQDNRKMVEKSQSIPFGYKHFIDITKDYHAQVCSTEQCIDYSKSTKQRKYLEYYAGGIQSWITIQHMKGVAKNLKPVFGFNLRFLPSQMFDAWNIVTGLSLSFNSIDENVYRYQPANGSLTGMMVSTNYAIFRTPLLVEYNLPVQNKVFKPFCTLGFSNSFIHYSKERINFVYKGNPSEIISDDYTSYKKRWMQGGVIAGVGFKCMVENEDYYFVRFQGEVRVPYTRLGDVLDDQETKAFIFCVGYGKNL